MTARAYLLRQLCDDPDARPMMRDGLLFTCAYTGDAASAGRTSGAVIGEADCTAFDGRRR